MTLWPYGGSESGLGGMSCLVPQPNGTQGSCVDGRERRSPTAPNAVLLDIGMTVVHPDGHKLLAHAAHARPGYTADPEDLARALCLASSASHWPLPRVGGVERVARVWSALVNLRPMEGLQTLQACFQDDDFYSEMEPDLRDTLKRLRAGDRRLAAITNSTRPVRDELERLGISDLFDAAVDSTAVGISKPKAGIGDGHCEEVVLGAPGWRDRQRQGRSRRHTVLCHAGLRGLLYGRRAVPARLTAYRA